MQRRKRFKADDDLVSDVMYRSSIPSRSFLWYHVWALKCTFKGTLICVRESCNGFHGWVHNIAVSLIEDGMNIAFPV